MRSALAFAAAVVATPRLPAQPARGVPDAGRMVREVMLEADTAGVAVAEQRWRPQVRGDKALTALLEGTLARLRYRSDDASRAFRVARADSLGRAGAYATIGLASLSGQRSQYTEALALYRLAATRMAQRADSAGQVEAMLGEAMTLLRTAGIVPATQRFRDAALLLPVGDAWLQARFGCLQLQVRVRASEVIADSSWQRALAAAGSQGPRVLSDCLFAQAQFLDARGKASALYAVPVPGHAAHDPAKLAATASAMGMAAVTAPDLTKALRAIARNSESPPLVLVTGSLHLAGKALALNGQAPV
jgi:hypothetical protein